MTRSSTIMPCSALAYLKNFRHCSQYIVPMNQNRIKANNYEFDCRIIGDPDDELVIFLHGFPETSAMWKRMMTKLAPEGYYCVAPNLRGYSPLARPKGKKNYHIDHLCADVLGIASTLNKTRFHLVGHDWGAVICWKLVHDNPDLFLSWTALSVPHINGFREALNRDQDQQHRSRYIKMFQWPFLPEYRIRKNDFQVFRKLWKNSSEDEMSDYLNTFRSKGCLTAALNYYRANFRSNSSFQIGKIKVPTLFVWGNKDVAIGRNAVQRNHDYMSDNYRFIEIETGHWLVQTVYTEVYDALLDHFKSNNK